MTGMFHNVLKPEEYKKDHLKPIIRNCIHTGEKSAGFLNMKTGEFKEIMQICSIRDLDEFLEIYEVSVAEIQSW